MIAVSNVAAVEVVHGAESIRRPEFVGRTVADVRTCLRHVLNIPSSAEGRLNGHEARPDDVLLPGDVLEYLDLPGQKGVDELLTPEEFMEFTGFLLTEYEYLLAQKMPIHELSDGVKLVMGEVREWLRNQPGLLMAAARTAVARARLRIDEDHGQAILDGRAYTVDSDRAAILQILLDNLGNWVSSTEMVDSCPRLLGVRPGRWIKALPEPIRALIDSSGKGCRLWLE